MAYGAVVQRAARLIAVVAALVGLFSMHGVGSSHPASATASVVAHSTAATAGEASGRQSFVAFDGRVESGGDALGGRLPGPAAPACAELCPEAAALCLTVLAGAAVAVLLVRRPTTTPAPPPPQRSLVASTPRSHAVLAKDPVRDLCISRT